LVTRVLPRARAALDHDVGTCSSAHGGARCATAGAGKKKGKKDASGDRRNGGEGCGDPVCPISGRVFLDLFDFGLAGPLPLRFVRSYSSRGSDREGQLGAGWSHELDWRLFEERKEVAVFDPTGREQRFAAPVAGESSVGGFGWRLEREGGSYRLRVDDCWWHFHRFGKTFHAIAKVDRHGNRIEIQRNERGAIVGLIDSAGRPLRFALDTQDRIVAIGVAEDARATSWVELARYSYDAFGDLVSFHDAEGHRWSYAYTNHLLVEHRAPTGLSYCYRYDGNDKAAYCLESWGEFIGSIDPALVEPLPIRPATGPDNRRVKGINYVRFTYSKGSQPYTEVENGLGGLARYFGDEANRVVQHVDFAAGVHTFSFDDTTGALLDQTDPTGASRVVERDEEGGVLGFRDTSGHQIVVFDDEDGCEVRLDETTGDASRAMRDRYGDICFAEHEDGSTETFEYDERGLVRAMVHRSGGQTVFHHDAQGNCVCVEHPDGGVEVREYDYLGRRTALVDTSGRRTEWRYDLRGEPQWKRHADGTEVHVEYDALRKPIAITECGRRTTFEYGGLGWLTALTGPDGARWQLRYDVEGHLVRVVVDRVDPRGIGEDRG
jgi:YD repeat-containing protein